TETYVRPVGVASGNVDQRAMVAAEGCAVLCTPPAAARVRDQVLRARDRAEPCAAPCTAKAQPPTAGPAARAPLDCYARIGLRRPGSAAQMRRHSGVETTTACVCWSW